MRQFRDATILRSDFERLHAGMQRAGRLLNWKVVDFIEDENIKALTLRDLALEGGMDDVVELVEQPPEPEPEPEPLLDAPADEEPTLEQWIAAGYLAENYERFVASRRSHQPIDDDQWDGNAVLDAALPDVKA